MFSFLLHWLRYFLASWIVPKGYVLYPVRPAGKVKSRLRGIA
jgi:hypothetical protein